MKTQTIVIKDKFAFKDFILQVFLRFGAVNFVVAYSRCL